MWATEYAPAPAPASNAGREEADRLGLPRILCLHGGGTNARIFRAQCRILEGMLKPYFHLCYAEAPFLSQAGPDVKAVYRNFAPFRAWLRWSPDDQVGDSEAVSEEIIAAIDAAVKEDDALGATGSWTGILGFSQGAKIAASILQNQQNYSQNQLGNWQSFRFGILLAGRGPTIQFSRPAATNSTSNMQQRLAIPTIHVHGQHDVNLHLHRKLLQDLCVEKSASVIEWSGGHRVPLTTTVVSSIVDEVLAVLNLGE